MFMVVTICYATSVIFAVPIVPVVLLDLVDAPVPFILGMTTESMHQVTPVAVIFCDIIGCSW